MHCGKTWWIREFVAPYIFHLNPDYVAARSLRSLRSNEYKNFLESTVFCRSINWKSSPESWQICSNRCLLQQLHRNTKAINPEWWYFCESGPSTNSDIKHPEVKSKNKFQAKHNEMWLLWEDDKKKSSKHNLLCLYWLFPPEMFRPDSLLLYLVMQ